MKTKLIGSKNPALMRPLVPASRSPKSPTPKARVMWQYEGEFFDEFLMSAHPLDDAGKQQLVLVRPFATKQQAMRAKLWANLNYEQKVETVAKALNRNASGKEFGPFFMEVDRRRARAILKLLGEGGEKK